MTSTPISVAPDSSAESGASAHANTKTVSVRLGALTRVEYFELVEVPADITEAELSALVDHRYEKVDGGMYSDDPEYWVRGTCCAEVELEPSSPATVRVRRSDAGSLLIESLPDGIEEHSDAD